MQNSEQIWQIVDEKRDDYIALSDRVWGMPELAYGEHRSVAEHLGHLEKEGFRITRDVAGIPTAVMAEAGEDGPVIAILGEYDALPGLSQQAGIAEPQAGRRRWRRGPWLRPQPAGLGRHARCLLREGLAGGTRA